LRICRRAFFFLLPLLSMFFPAPSSLSLPSLSCSWLPSLPLHLASESRRAQARALHPTRDTENEADRDNQRKKREREGGEKTSREAISTEAPSLDLSRPPSTSTLSSLLTSSAPSPLPPPSIRGNSKNTRQKKNQPKPNKTLSSTRRSRRSARAPTASSTRPATARRARRSPSRKSGSSRRRKGCPRRPSGRSPS
jgi:hypothetical protein